MEIDPTHGGLAIPVKPALKKIGSTKHSKHHDLKWDEPTIEEHDLLRGTRMKIDEPNTPYHYDSGSENEADAGGSPTGRKPKATTAAAAGGGGIGDISWDHLERKLDSVAAVRDAYPMHSPNTSQGSGMNIDGSGEGGSGGSKAHPNLTEEELKALEFKEHRKRHYNEMELVRRFRAQQAEEEDEDADDEED